MVARHTVIGLWTERLKICAVRRGGVHHFTASFDGHQATNNDGVLTKPCREYTPPQFRMNVEASGAGIRRRVATDDAGRGEMDIHVVPLELYDSARAKITANLSWLFSKAFGTDDVPSELQDPFYTDQYEQEHIKPPIIHLLLSSELYCIVCGLILPEHATSLRNHTSVLQALSKRGISVLDNKDTRISELDLSSAPIKMSSHIHLIDALMMAFTEEIISVEKVMSSVKCFSEISDSTEVPLDLEAALVFWINKVITQLRGFTQTKLKMRHHSVDSGHHKVHFHKDELSGQCQHFSLLDNLSNFVCNGTALMAVIHFYCPELIKLEDICLKATSTTTESLYNIALLKEFSDEFLNKCFHLRPEDLLYSPPLLKINMMQYIAELFWTFEIVTPDFMPRRDIPETKDARTLWHQQRPYAPKQRSWTLNSKNTTAGATGPEICFKTNSNLFVLPRCQKELEVIQDHAIDCVYVGQKICPKSLTPTQQSTTFPRSRNRQRSLSQTVQSASIFPMKEDVNSINPARSLNKHHAAPKFMSTNPGCMPGSGNPHKLSGQRLLSHIRFEDEEEEIEEEELVRIIDPTTLPRRHHQRETVQKDFKFIGAPRVINTQAHNACPSLTEQPMDTYYLEPLMPAIRKPSKEKSVRVKKEEECGESGSKYMCNTSLSSLKAATQDSSGVSHQDNSKLSRGFYLHLVEEPKGDAPLSSLDASNDSDSENLSDNENEQQLIGNRVRAQEGYYRNEQSNFEEGESPKLGEDLKVNEWDDEEDHSERSSECLGSRTCNTPSGNGIKMTSFVEKRRLKLGCDGLSSAGTTPKTSPNEAAPGPPWQMKTSAKSYSLDKRSCAVSRNNVLVPPEFLELHMELEERRNAIEGQKKKMENTSAQQRLKLGKAAFLNIVKKEPGKSDTLPLPRKQESSVLGAAGKSKVNILNFKDDSCLEALKVQAVQNDKSQLLRDNKLSKDSGQDLNVCSRSIEVLNETIATIQQQIMQLSQQQDLLIKQSVTNSSTDPSAVNIEDSSSFSSQPKLSSSQHKASSKTQKYFQIFDNKVNKDVKTEVIEKCKTEQDKAGGGTFSDCNVINQQCAKDKSEYLPITSETPVNVSRAAAGKDQRGQRETQTADSEPEACDVPDKNSRTKTALLEVDLSEMREPTDAENEQKNALGFFFKDEESTDEMAKRRAAFLIKQQRKAEEAKLRKQQLEAESEVKRDETRRKAEEERIRKEEEKARREFIKQEYLRRKQEMLIEEQGLVKSLPRTRVRKSTPKSLHREGPSRLFKRTPTPDLSDSRRGSTLSLATEAESIISIESQRAESVCSVDSSMMSRASSRNMDRDWEIGSIASSITSTEYTGPKLFKEPSSKSNKPIIINAIAHCCLAGKVNEIQKNVILEELDKCESNHLIILFRDGGCQFRAIYSYSPDTEEITKVTGTGPRNISQKMIDKLYKYSSDRKQFSVIPARSVSVSIDALTIHNHLWHVRRPGSARKK